MRHIDDAFRPVPGVTAKMEADACSDCPARLEYAPMQGVLAAVTVVRVGHEETCPWWSRVAAGRDSAVVVSAGGVLIHFRVGGESEGVVGDVS